MAVTQGTSPANRDREPLQDHTWFNSLPTSPPNIAHQRSAHRTPKNGDPKGTGALRHKSPTEAQGASVAAQGEGGFGGFPLLLNPPSEREQGKPSCPTAPKPEASAEHEKKNPHSPPRCTSAFPGTFHHHRHGSHRPWVPENPPAPPQRPAQTIPCPFACGSLRPGSLPVPSSSQHVRPGAAAPPWISPPSSPALLAATLHPCVPPPASGCCHSPAPAPGTSRIKGAWTGTIPNPSPGWALSVPPMPGAPRGGLLPSLGGNPEGFHVAHQLLE